MSMYELIYELQPTDFVISMPYLVSWMTLQSFWKSLVTLLFKNILQA